MSDDNGQGAFQGPFHAKTIVESPNVTEYIDNLNAEHGYRFNRDIMEQVNWALTKNISSRPNLCSGNYYVYKMILADIVFSHLTIFYIENENEITLLGIKAIPILS